ncbi:MAG: helix-turn-helix domain-containing protein [Pseudomonadota bacterium]|nr:helix-turn-helix domain-containing protein [Pseudomonadota bacterium]
MMGAVNEELAKFFNVHVDTIEEWTHVHPEFSEALKKGRQYADANVAKSLYHRALGYKHEIEKVLVIDKEVIKIKYTEKFPPDVTACIFWLKVRRSWKEKRDDLSSSSDLLNDPDPDV